MSSIEPSARRAILVCAMVLCAEAAAYLGLLILPAAPTAPGTGDARAEVGIVLFIAGYALVHVLLAAGLLRRWTHVRGAVVATQVIQLGLAWNLRAAEPVWLPSVLALAAVIVLVSVLRPAVTQAIHDDTV